MSFTANDVKMLRERTGAGMMDCKNALVETNGDMDKAVDYLREKGIAKAAKKAGRIAAEGLVESYIHMGGKVGVMVEACPFTSGEDVLHDVALQIAAMKPLFVSIDEVDAVALEKEREIFRAQAKNEGKPEAVIEKMVEGRVKKYYKEVVLMEQDYVKDPSITVKQLITQTVAAIGEKITVRRFVRYEMGEGLEKRKDTFVDEIASQMEQLNK